LYRGSAIISECLQQVTHTDSASEKDTIAQAVRCGSAPLNRLKEERGNVISDQAIGFEQVYRKTGAPLLPFPQLDFTKRFGQPFSTRLAAKAIQPSLAYPSALQTLKARCLDSYF